MHTLCEANKQYAHNMVNSPQSTIQRQPCVEASKAHLEEQHSARSYSKVVEACIAALMRRDGISEVLLLHKQYKSV
jgi:hypothetical protein